MSLGRGIAIVPAWNEERAVASVVVGIRSVDPALDVVVVDDASTDLTADRAREAGAFVVRLPFNLGIGGAVQTGFQFAREGGYDFAVRLDGDGQHDPSELPKLLEALERGDADIVVGSRFANGANGRRGPIARRAGIVFFARLVSLLTRQKVTDTTSGFQALNRRGIGIFAADYPHDYPEVEATVMVHKHRLRLVEVPVLMRDREYGSSSITALRSIYYVLKVTLALLVGMLRSYAVPAEESHS